MRRGVVTRSLVLAAIALTVAACSGEPFGVPATSTPQPASTSTTSAARPTDAPDTTPDPTTGSGPATTEPQTARPVTPLPGLVNPADDPIVDDREAVTGVLPNGLTYWVRHNDQPGQKVSLRLAVRAGSADELGPETGVAHFLEHMLFNGTERFPENELVDVLRGFGAEFGPDVNAYTSYDETVYELDVPNDAESVALAVDVLHEWLTAATIDPAQVAAERGVVLDEWRGSTQSVDGRLFELAADHYLAGTRYEDRDPIGTAESIQAMESDVLRGFYDTWYRPDNAAVIIVGDVDVADMVDIVATRFGDAEPRLPESAPRTPAGIEPFSEPAFVLHADPDQTTVDVEVTLPLPADDAPGGTAALRTRLLDEVVYDALVRRLARDAAAGDAPFDDVVPGSNSFVDGLDAPALYAFTDAARSADTLRALLDEYERAFRYGFDAGEVATAVEAVRAQYDTLFGPDGEAQDWEIADTFVARFLAGEPAPGRAEAYLLVTAELDAIDPVAVAERFNARYTNTAPQVIVSVPERQADDVPTGPEVLDAIAATADRELDPRRAAADLPDALMERPTPIEPSNERAMSAVEWDIFDPIEYTYPNGARVVLVPNDIAQGEVFLQASSPGGTSMVPVADIVDALFATEVVAASGAGEFGSADLEQIVSGFDVELTPELTTYREGWWGRAASGDAEALLALLNLRMSATTVDPVALRQTVQYYQPIVDDPSNDPGLAGTDALNEARYGDAPHYDVLPDPDEFATLDADGVERVWTDRFGDASDWVFVLAGDFDRSQMRALADSYIGSLPGTRGVEQPPTVTPAPPAQPASVAVHAGTGEAASVEMLFTSPVDGFDPEFDALVAVATSVVEARLTRVVREEFGDSYSPYAISWVDEDPDPVVLTYVYASGAPDRIAAIAETARAELSALANGEFTDSEFANARAPVVERYEYVDNGEFLTQLLREAWNPDYDLTGYIYKHEAVSAVTRADVQEFLAEHVPVDRYSEAVVTPRG
jgi:zinc protease